MNANKLLQLLENEEWPDSLCKKEVFSLLEKLLICENTHEYFCSCRPLRIHFLNMAYSTTLLDENAPKKLLKHLSSDMSRHVRYFPFLERCWGSIRNRMQLPSSIRFVRFRQLKTPPEEMM